MLVLFTPKDSIQSKTCAMKIAVEGCCHGELDKIYETIAYLEKKEGVKVDLLLCCGDFQAVRNEEDMKCMAVPAKYRRMQSFYKSVFELPFSFTLVQDMSTIIMACFIRQILFWREEGSDPDNLHWREPRGFQSPTGAPLWRVGGTQHLLPR